jgi:hypothetical protein
VFRPQATERDLLRACRDGSELAVAALVERHVRGGISTARRLAAAQIADDDILELVYDAFINAFDKSLDGSDASFEVAYHQLIRTLVQAMAASGDAFDARRGISPSDLRQLRDDLVRELCVTVVIHAESPTARTPAQRLLAELRKVRRRLRLPMAAARENA